jgi:DNA-binding transcriptional MerR regulator
MTSTFRVEELATATGLAVDTIRYYQTKGLIDPPAREGRTAVYNEAHRMRVETIRRLADAGFTLSQIKQLVEGTEDKLLTALAGESDQTLSLEQLATAAEVDPQVVHMAVAAGLLGPVGADADRFDADSVRLVRTARDLIQSQIPLNDLVNLATRHAANVEAVADEAIELFSRHIGSDTDDDLVDTYRRLMAQTTKLVADHFQRTLLERGRTRVDAEVDPQLATALMDPDSRLVVTCEWI